MNLDEVRLGALFVPTTAIWIGSVSAWNSDTFTLTVTTSTGSLSAVSAGLAVAWEGQYIRIRSVDSGAGTITLAETGAAIEASDSVSVYAPRLLFPRYQYIDSDGNVYKDRDIAWSSAAATLPPRAWIWVENPSGGGGYSEAIWVQTSTSVTVVATASLVMSAEATTGVLTYQWASDADATIAAPTSSETTVSWSSAGFRYLKLTVTDDQSVSTVRYIPVWVGDANLIDVRALSLDWEASRGWRAQVQLDSLTTYLRGAPVAIVDLETTDVIYLGWHYPGQWTQDFEITSIEFELRGAFGYASAIYSYPFIIEDVDAPSEWAHVSELTLERAVWYLLYWHSTLPQIANVGPGTAPDNRRIAGQEFTAGTLADQLRELNEAAFRYVTGYRSGGFTLYEHPLYMTSTEFNGLSAIDLSAQTAIIGELDIEKAQPTVAEARLSGVYYGVGDDQFKPIIARGPTHPLPWGNTEEVTNLAPLNQTEILRWATRYIALRNTADRYTVHPRTLDVQPADGRVIDLPDSVRMALEEVYLTYNVEALAWDADVVGRTFGDDVSVAVEPPPPAIEPPDPPTPPELPPFEPPIPPPEYDWPSRIWVATEYGIYETTNFTPPEEPEQPTWLPIHDLAFEEISYLRVDTDGGWGYCTAKIEIGGSHEWNIYRRSLEGDTWESILTKSQAESILGVDIYETVNRPLDMDEDGRLYVVLVELDSANRYILKWDGAWSVHCTWVRNRIPRRMLVRGGGATIALSLESKYPVFGAWTGCVQLSVDGGGTFQTRFEGSYYGRPRLTRVGITPAQLNAFYYRFSGLQRGYEGESSLERDTIDDDDLNVNPGAHWISNEQANWQRMVADNKILETTDTWASKQVMRDLVGDAATVYHQMVVLHEGSDYESDWMLLGHAGPDEDQPHTIVAYSDLDGIVGRSGVAPGLEPYENSIPYTAGGIVDQGIQVVGYDES